jgi:hypothetical protein
MPAIQRDAVEKESAKLFESGAANVDARAPQAPDAAVAPHIVERCIDAAAPPRERADAPGPGQVRLVRKPIPDRHPPGRAARGQRRTAEEDALLRAAVIELEGWTGRWSHIAEAVASRTARACELRVGKLPADAS